MTHSQSLLLIPVTMTSASPQGQTVKVVLLGNIVILLNDNIPLGYFQVLFYNETYKQEKKKDFSPLLGETDSNC